MDAALLASVATIPEQHAFLPLLIGGLVSLVGAGIQGATARKTAKDRTQAEILQAQQQYANDEAAAKRQRTWNIADRDEARAYDIKMRNEDRAYDKSQVTEARQYSRNVLTHLVEDAEKAGFNPLTVLRAGGGSGYNAAAGFAPVLSQPLPSYQTAGVNAPVMRAPLAHVADPGAAFGEAFASIGANIANFDPHADDRRELEYRLMEAQIGNLNASSQSYRSQSFNVPVYTAGPVSRQPSAAPAALSSSLPPAIYEPHPDRFGGSILPEIETPKVTNPWPGKWGRQIDPNVPNAEMFEDRYGEFAGSAIGSAVTIFSDLPQLAKNFPDFLGITEWMRGSSKGPRLRR